MSLGPFDLTGGPFLTLYGVLLGFTLLVGFLIPNWRRPEGRDATTLDAERLAYLAGGEIRFADTVVTRLMATDALTLSNKALCPNPQATAGTPAERALRALPAPVKWSVAEPVLRRAAGSVERSLVADGLLMDAETTLRMRAWQTAPYLLLLAFGATKWIIGTARERPVEYLTFMMALTVLFALIRFARINRRTHGGEAALARASAAADRIRRAPNQEEVDLAVALFGTGVLVGSPWAGFHQMRSADGGSGGGDSGGGDSGSGDSGGGGGCGGGGCGGCGS